MKNQSLMMKGQGLSGKGQENTFFIFCFLFFVFCLFSLTLNPLPLTLHPSLSAVCFAQENPASSELITEAWDAQGKKEYDKVFEWTQKCIDLYRDEADIEHALVKDYPSEAQEPLSDVAVAYFIQAEAYMRQEKTKEAIEKFQYVIDHYRYAVAWDPSRGVFWKVAKVSQESIDKIKGASSGIAAEPPKPQGPKTTVTLYDPGREEVVNYEKYGEFNDVGSKEYKYVVKDQEGLSRAVGEGIYPNTTSVRWDPELKKAYKEKRLQGAHWDFVHSRDLEAAFLRWATANEPEGVKLYYTGLILEKAGLIKHALKAYYAIVVHYPGAVGWTYWHTPWYVGPVAISKIKFILRHHPEYGLKLTDARIRIINGYDNDVSNDIVMANPGKIEKISKISLMINRVKEISNFGRQRKIPTKTIGAGEVKLQQYSDSSWQILVNNRPYILKGITYAPTKIGQSPDEGTLGNWMTEDFNKNGKIDGPYDAYLDSDPAKKPVGDFQLMKDMGVNTIRLYHHPKPINKELTRDLYKFYGIKVIVGDFLGKYALGSGAPWKPGTDYSNPEHQKAMLDSVRKMVEEFKDEPYVLFWLLGNENVYGVACNADKDPESFFKFANDAAKLIKSLDKDHPVAIASGDMIYLDKFGKLAPDIDIFGANVYRGNYGFGNFWQSVKEEVGRPAMITEYGCPAYAEGIALDEAEEAQARYHQGCWSDITANMDTKEGVGNAIGGIVFEYLDEWWKAYEPYKHDTKGFFTGPFPDGYMHEEWLGVAGQGDGKDSPFKRHLRKAYYMYQKVWK